MPVELTHQHVRNLAKKLREITGREIKHTEIIDAIASALGRRPDAMMHELKNEAPQAQAENPSANTPEASKKLAEESGLEVWHTGGGCFAFAKLLKEVETPGGDVACLELMITDQSGTSINAGPNDQVWMTGVTYQDPRGGDTVMGAREEAVTLHEAIATALMYALETDRLWEENYDPEAIALRENGKAFK